VTAGSKAGRFESLDSLRGVCACLVAAGHLLTSSPLTTSHFFRSTYLFVDFFFILSGFVICWNYESKLGNSRQIADFVILRLGRLYPLHLLVLLALLALEALAYLQYPNLLGHKPFDNETSLASFVSSLFLLQSLNLHNVGTWNDPSWSISSEFWVYLTFALTCLTTGFRKVYFFAIPVLLVLLMTSPYGMNSTFDFAFPRCLMGFAIGVGCCKLFKAGIGPATRLNASLLEAAAVIAVGVVVGTDASPFLAPFVMAAAVLVFAHDKGWLSDALRSRPFAAMGRISYSIYMVHWFVANIFWIGTNYLRKAFGTDYWGHVTVDGHATQAYGNSALSSSVFTLLFLGSLIALSFMTYRFVEAPGRRWARRIVRTTTSGSSSPALPIQAPRG
jgi:peptidoglycan/LPS O-acetylase OafA/YrhL